MIEREVKPNPGERLSMDMRRTVSFYAPKESVVELDKLADLLGLNRSQTINRILGHYVPRLLARREAQLAEREANKPPPPPPPPPPLPEKAHIKNKNPKTAK